MQAKISRSTIEAQEVIGRVMDVVNPRDEVLLIETEPVTSRFVYPVEAASPALTQMSQAEVLTLFGRQILQLMSTAASLEGTLSEVAAILGNLYGVQACLISLPYTAWSMVKGGSWFARPQITSGQQNEILLNYPAIEAATLDAGFFCASDFLAHECRSQWQISSPIRSLLSMTASFQNQVNGVICLMRSQPHDWTELEVNTLAQIAAHIASVISQMTLQQRVAKQAQFQGLLRQVTLSIQESLELSQILKQALSGTAEALNVEQALILRLRFWDPRQSVRAFERVPKARVSVDCAWYHPNLDRSSDTPNESDEPSLSQSFWVSECVLCQAAIRSSQSLSLTDASEFPSITETAGIAPILHPDSMASLLLVPLESKNRLLGFIALQQRQPRIWQHEEIEFAELVGGQISSAIMQTETLRQVESLVEERTAQLQQSLELQAKLYDITRKQIDKLRQMNQRMDEFLSTLSHELRTPLTSMMLAIRMLRQANLPADRRQQYLNILEQQCAQETNLINDLLALQELETKQVALQLQRVDLKQVINELSQSFNQRWSSKGLQLNVKLPKRSLILNTDLASLNRILLELLTNAGKYAEPNSTVQLKIAAQASQQLQIALVNTGSGISEEEMPHIFDKFRRCQGMTQNAVPGTGLGLALVKSLVQHLNGSIEATSEPIEAGQSYETCFKVTLPQNLEIVEA
jgi:signal transduction histidine kinase